MLEYCYIHYKTGRSYSTQYFKISVDFYRKATNLGIEDNYKEKYVKIHVGLEL